MGEMMSVQLMQLLRVELTSVALDEALVVGLVGDVPDIVEQVGLVGLQLLLLADIVHGVQLLKLTIFIVEDCLLFEFK